MRKYLKRRVKSDDNITKVLNEGFKTNCGTGRAKKFMVLCSIPFFIVLLLIIFNFIESTETISLDGEDFLFMNNPVLATAPSKKNVISVPKGVVKANPFVPYRDISGISTIPDVPEFNLVPPPEVVNDNSDAARVMDTIVSGILFDKYSPSAIINIEGSDYLVKKGDVVNGYKILAITVDSVSVKLGSNVYKAGIGEILTEGVVNHNNVSNLNNKFGGVK